MPVGIAPLAKIARASTEGRQLSPEEQKALRVHANTPIMAAALCYAELIADGEAVISELSSDSAAASRLTRLREGLARQRWTVVGKLEERHKAALTEAYRPRNAPDCLDALVLRHLAFDQFQSALNSVLKSRGLRTDAIDVPRRDLWGWLARNGATATLDTTELPPGVQYLRQLDQKSFLAALLADANNAEVGAALAHEALIERRADSARDVTARLLKARKAVERELLKVPVRLRSQRQFARLRSTAEAYARGSARSLLSELKAAELLLRAVQAHGQKRSQKLRAECLRAAAAAVTAAAPELGEEVVAACAMHRAGCPQAKQSPPCVDCAHGVADRLRPQIRVYTSGRVAVGSPAARPAMATRGEQSSMVPVTPIVNASDSFVCDEVLRRVAGGSTTLVAVVETHHRSDAGLFGFSWISESGELRTGFDNASNAHDGAVRALCKAALDLDDDSLQIRLVTRDAKAADVVQGVMRTGTVVEEAQPPLSTRTVELLLDLIERRPRMSVHVDPCLYPHQGATAAQQLAVLALRAGQGLEASDRVRIEADQLSREVSQGVGGKLIGPGEEGEHAWWLNDESRHASGLRWCLAVRRVHLDEEWCPIPGGWVPGAWLGRRFRLHLNHQHAGPPGTNRANEVVLGRRGGQWAFGGIRWPRSLPPGTLVTFNWQLEDTRVSAYTTRLLFPEKIDGVEYSHRYEPQVVTREVALGLAQARGVSDLSDASWVLHTLRKLGYLSVDGTATLAEEALVRNCIALGLPQRRADGLSVVIDQLLRSGRIQRVQGSLDLDGRPWCPPRPGHVRTALLRYVPRVESVTASRDGGFPQSDRAGHWVAGFVRRLPPGARASAEQIEAHRDAVRAHELVDRDLPEGFTYVRRHHRAR
ncbi:hypothetical protein [Micromonospora echinospora]|uniref:hypothetical protein n=1 Tax=Micromonospora echinospora TaxID=1877 RepID=UPI00366BB756